MDKLEKYELFSLNNIAQLIPGNVYWKGLNGVYHGCSKACADMLKLTPEEFIGKTIYDVQPYELAKVIDENDRKVMETNQEYTFEEEVINQYDENAIYLTKKTPLRDKNGKILGMLGVSFNITERKQLDLMLQKESKKAKSQLQANDIHLRDILEKLPVNIFWMNKEGYVIGCNERQARIFGLASADELYGKNVFDIGKIAKWPAEITEKIHHTNCEVISTGIRQITEEVGLLDGEMLTFLSYKHPLYDDNGDIIGIIGATVDITERKAKEQSTEIYLQHILQNLPENIYWTDKEGVVIGCNDQQAKFFGLASADKVYGKNIFDIGKTLSWTPEITEKIQQGYKEVMSTGITQIIEETVPVQNQAHTFLSYKSPLRDNTDNITGIIGISLDITERKRLEQSLKKAQETAEYYLHSIIEKLPECIYWLDKEGRIIGCNDRQAKIFGSDCPKDVFGKNIFDICKIMGFSHEVAQKIHENDRDIMATGVGQVFEETTSLQGKIRAFLSYKNPIYDIDDNTIIGIIGISVDITERKNLEESLEKAKEEAEQASHAKSEFIMNMRHDLKTPTSGMLGLAELLLNNETNPAKKQQLTYLVNSCHKLAQLLDEIIDITAIGGNKLETLNTERFSITQATHDVIALLLPEAINKELDLIWHIDDNIPDPLFGDRIRLHRILLNLISNALKFTAQGSVTLDVSCKEKNNEHAVLLFTISDTGIGIAKEHHEKIFERFQRVTSSYQGVYKGTGLGLHVVKEFVTELGGNICVDSELGHGTIFHLEIPFALSAENESMKDTEEQLDLQLNLPKNAKVLIVEDNIIAQKIAETILQSFTSQVHLASTGAEALEKTQAPFDLIFLDIGLPDSSGFIISQQIRDNQAANCNTPIIGLSAHIDRKAKRQAVQHGMTALLSKPLTDDVCQRLFAESISE